MEKIQDIEKLLQNDWKFLEYIHNLLKNENVLNTNSENKIVEFVQPNELMKLIDLSIQDDKSLTHEELLNICKKIIKYSVKTNHPRFHNQLYAQLDPYGLAGAWITEALNTSAYTYEVAPVFSLMETEIIQKICQLCGYTSADGIFSPGGSISNMYGIILARYKVLPFVKTEGLANMPQLVLFTSEESHYSLKKGSHWLGIGTNNHISIKTNNKGQMIIEDLKEKIQKALDENKKPFFVNATAGSTVLGAFDDITKIADICENYGLWLHVDACHGGAVLLTKENRHLVKDIHRANSVSWNPHKAIGAPLQCALFVTKEMNLLAECNSADAKYLFQQDKFYDTSYDTGNKSIQCGRKIDAFKLWLMFKARGLSTYGSLVDHSIQMAKLFAQKLQIREGFQLVQDEFVYTNVCFWYIPNSMRKLERTSEWYTQLYKVAPEIKEKMVKTGSLMVGYSPLPYRNYGNFLRMVFTSFPVLTENELDWLIQEIERFGEQ